MPFEVTHQTIWKSEIRYARKWLKRAFEQQAEERIATRDLYRWADDGGRSE
jgi:hypothetical protein